MTKSRKLSNGQILNFPEQMPDEEVDAVIRKKFPASNNEVQIMDQVQNAPENIKNVPQKTFWQRYQDFMQPKTIDRNEENMPETFLGRMPKNIPEFERGTPQNKEMFKEMIVAGAGAPGIKTIAEAVPKLTLSNIAKNIVESRNKEKLFHNNEYNKIWRLANKEGLNKVKFNPKEIDMTALTSSGVNKKYIISLQKFMENPILENAQKAQSDLGKLINSPQLSKEVLTSEENAIKKIAEKTQSHIKNVMFKNSKGEVNQPLKNMYDKVTASYEKNMIPYKNANITKYAKGKMTAKQLLSKLKSSEFMATKGAAHPAIENRDRALEALKYLGVPTGVGLGLTGGSYLINKLLGKNE